MLGQRQVHLEERATGLRSEWLVWILTVICGALIVFSIFGAGRSSLRADGRLSDASFDWLTAKATVGAGGPSDRIDELASIYLDDGVSRSERPHPRTPGALILQLPLAAVPHDWARSIMQGWIVVALSTVGVVAVKVSRLEMWWAPVIGLGLLVFTPGMAALKVGSQGPLVAGLVALAWMWGDKTKSGVALGMAATLKLFPGLLVVMVLMSGRRKVGVAAISTFVGLNVFGLLLPDVTVESSLSTLQAQIGVAHAANMSLGLPIGAVVASCVVLIWVARWTNWNQLFALGSVGTFFVSPLVHNHYLAIVAVPVIWAGMSFARWAVRFASTPERSEEPILDRS